MRRTADTDVQPVEHRVAGEEHDRRPAGAPGIQNVAADQRLELAADVALGLVSEEPPPLPPSGPERSIPEVGGLETYEAGVLSSGPVESASLETEAFFDPAPERAAPADDSRRAPGPEAPVAPAGAFVTETMAELYLQQGHLDSAVDIYRQLVEQRPADLTLRARLHELEARTHGKQPTSERDAGSRATVPIYGGPTIREFLVGLASRRMPVAGTGAPSSAVTSETQSRREPAAVTNNESAIAESGS